MAVGGSLCSTVQMKCNEFLFASKIKLASYSESMHSVRKISIFKTLTVVVIRDKRGSAEERTKQNTGHELEVQNKDL